VRLSRVDPDGAERAERLGVRWHHPDRVPVEPTLPDLIADHPGARIERKLRGAVVGSGETGGDAVDAEQRLVGPLSERGPRAEVAPPARDVAVVVTQRAHAVAELGDVTQLVQRVACMRSEGAEDIGPEHGGDHGAEAAAGLARDRPMLWR